MFFSAQVQMNKKLLHFSKWWIHQVKPKNILHLVMVDGRKHGQPCLKLLPSKLMNKILRKRKWIEKNTRESGKPWLIMVLKVHYMVSLMLCMVLIVNLQDKNLLMKWKVILKSTTFSTRKKLEKDSSCGKKTRQHLKNSKKHDHLSNSL